MSSKRAVRRRGCAGKVAYHELGHAFAAQKGHALTFHETLAVYWCPFCHHYHLGHPRLGERRTRRNFRELT